MAKFDMNTKRVVILYLVGIVLAACAPTTPSPVNVILPTQPPTPFPLMEYNTGQEYELTEMQDAQGRTIMKNLGDGLYRFFVYEDGYDRNVGYGLLFLKAGHNYTFEWFGNRELVEVRSTADDQLVGYWLQTMAYDAGTGSFLGVEMPIALVDANSDGLMSLQELENALTSLGEDVRGISASQPSFAAKFDTDIASIRNAINSRKIADAYRKIKQLQIEIDAVEQAIIAAQAADEQAAEELRTLIYVYIAIVAVTLFLIAFWLVRRYISTKAGQRLDTPVDNPD